MKDFRYYFSVGCFPSLHARKYPPRSHVLLQSQSSEKSETNGYLSELDRRGILQYFMEENTQPVAGTSRAGHLSTYERVFNDSLNLLDEQKFMDAIELLEKLKLALPKSLQSNDISLLSNSICSGFWS